MNKKASISNFWRALELFQPQNISRETTSDESRKLKDVELEIKLPWLASENAKANDFFRIYCGVVEIEDFVKELQRRFNVSQCEDYQGKNEGRTAVFTFIVNKDGEAVEGTFNLASSAWLLGKTTSIQDLNSIKLLDGFEKDSSKIAEYFEQRISLLQEKNRASNSNNNIESKYQPLAVFDIEKTTREICEKLGLSEFVQPDKISYRAFPKKFITESKESEENLAENSDILNSFFQNDLKLVSEQLKAGNYGIALSEYLTDDEELNISKRIDLKDSVETIFHNFSPEIFPSGRWADKGLFSLAFGQQFAVNTIIKSLGRGNGGLFSVNGPPGTGKTTMLKDIIAALIVERAKVLVGFAEPAKAFYSEGKYWENREGKSKSVLTIDARLKSFGIVIASSNNKAVENVTMEFPVKTALDERWQEQCSYFSETASDLIGKPAWGLIAAPLGKSENRKNFNNKVWFGENGLLGILKNIETQEGDLATRNWKSAVGEFKQALEREQVIKQRKIGIHKILSEKMILENRHPDIIKSKHAVQSEIAQAEEHIKNLTVKKGLLEEEQDTFSRQKEIHNANRPGIFLIITSWGQFFKEWRAGDIKIKREISAISEKVFDAQSKLSKARSLHQELENNFDRLEKELIQNRGRIAEIEDILSVAQSDGKNDSIPKIEDWADPGKRDERELSAPWFDEEWNQARVEVFAKAIQLHKAFILANAKSVKKNLDVFVDLLKGKFTGDDRKQAAAEIWATLFLVIPVVSTTFASFAKQFKTLRREEIGWLLIDEAGQTVPQAAAGAIWRSRRVIAVGDPLQLEPVSTIPFEIEKTLAQKFGVSETWFPNRTSVQELADRINIIGTYIGEEDEKIWVGSPLVVHRRCLNPMFAVSNAIAYNDLMVYGTPGRESEFNLPESCWINVKSEEAQNHWIPAEGKCALALLDKLKTLGCPPKNIYIISPFSQVAGELGYLERQKGIRTVGTVHKMQGKENDVVILVLGGNPQKPGAKIWASAKPNLLNVAVSRAKNRLYVIGSSEWSQMRYFGELYKILKKYES